MLQTGHVPGISRPLASSSGPRKRPRPESSDMQNMPLKTRIYAESGQKMSNISPQQHKVDILIGTEKTETKPIQSKATIEQKQKLIVMRFKRALRKNNSTMLQRCLESGYIPTIQEWLCIIGKIHVSTALVCVSLSRTLETH